VSATETLDPGALARLREAKHRYYDQQFELGRRAGREWALSEADFAELDRLAPLQLHVPFDDPARAVRLTAEAIGCEQDELLELLPDRVTVPYMRGFVQGARDVRFSVGYTTSTTSKGNVNEQQHNGHAG
jgi:hypothetical protein